MHWFQYGYNISNQNIKLLVINAFFKYSKNLLALEVN